MGPPVLPVCSPCSPADNGHVVHTVCLDASKAVHAFKSFGRQYHFTVLLYLYSLTVYNIIMANNADDCVPQTLTDFVFDLYDSVTLSQLPEEQGRLYNTVLRDLSSKVCI